MPVGREEGAEIASRHTGHIQQETGDVVRHIACGPWNRGLGGVKRVGATRAEGLELQQVVANAANVGAELDGMILQCFGPVVDEVDVGFAANPGHGTADC